MKKTKERGSVRSTLQQMKKSYMLYIFLLPSVILIAIFCYAPMYGVLMAFQNFSPSKGIMGSPWVGFKWFETFFNMPRFWQILGNTLTLSVYSLLVGFPIPIILAILINSVENDRFKRVTQTVTYMPHFISTVVLVGMITVFLSPRSGFLNHFFELLGAAEDTYYMGIAECFPHIYVWSGVWQDTIPALAAISWETTALLTGSCTRGPSIRWATPSRASASSRSLKRRSPGAPGSCSTATTIGGHTATTSRTSRPSG